MDNPSPPTNTTSPAQMANSTAPPTTLDTTTPTATQNTKPATQPESKADEPIPVTQQAQPEDPSPDSQPDSVAQKPEADVELSDSSISPVEDAQPEPETDSSAATSVDDAAPALPTTDSTTTDVAPDLSENVQIAPATDQEQQQQDQQQQQVEDVEEIATTFVPVANNNSELEAAVFVPAPAASTLNNVGILPALPPVNINYEGIHPICIILFSIWILCTTLLAFLELVNFWRRRKEGHAVKSLSLPLRDNNSISDKLYDAQFSSNHSCKIAIKISDPDGMETQETSANDSPVLGVNISKPNLDPESPSFAHARPSILYRRDSELDRKVSPNDSKSLTKHSSQNSAVQVPPEQPPTFRIFLRSIFFIGLVVIYSYLCEVKTLWGDGNPPSFGHDIFCFFLFAFSVLSVLLTTEGPAKKPKILSSDLTNEWKGWMNLVFIMYHYYAASSTTYNAIRVFTSTYVWMLIFNAFSYMLTRKDYSIVRAAKTLFQINFLATLICLVTLNQSMVYHLNVVLSFWLILTYSFLAILPSWNTILSKMAIKFCVYTILVALIFEIPDIGNTLFHPFTFVIGYNGSLSEWMYRVGTERYVALGAMLFAFFYPKFEEWIKNLEKSLRGESINGVPPSVLRKLSATVQKMVLFAVGITGVAVWITQFNPMNKVEYDRIHPFIFFIPILAYLFLRNISTSIRSYHVGAFAWLGKIYLETFVLHLHIWLSLNGTMQIYYLSTSYPLMNFVVSTSIYLYCAHRAYTATSHIASYIFGVGGISI